MAVTFWIIFIFFAALAVLFTIKFFFGQMTPTVTFVWILSVVISAIGLGMLYGDLDEKIFNENIVGPPTSKIERVIDTVTDGVKDTLHQAEEAIKD